MSNEEHMYFELALRNNIFHSINNEVYKECKVRLTMFHSLYLERKIDLKTLQVNLNRNGE